MLIEILSEEVTNSNSICQNLHLRCPLVSPNSNFGKLSIFLLFHLPSLTDVPDAPSIPMLLDKTSRTVRISWFPPMPNNSPISRYFVQYNTSITSMRRPTTDHHPSSFIDGLQPWTVIMIEVAAENEVGVGPFGPFLIVTTDEEGMGFKHKRRACATDCECIHRIPASVTLRHEHNNVPSDLLKRCAFKFSPFPFCHTVPGPPSLQSVTAESSSTLRVTWTAPEMPNGVILRYEIRYMSIAGDSVVNNPNGTVTVATPGVTSTVLENLDAYQTYSITVRAFTSVGAGAASNSQLGTTLPGGEAKPLNHSSPLR